MQHTGTAARSGQRTVQLVSGQQREDTGPVTAHTTHITVVLLPLHTLSVSQCSKGGVSNIVSLFIIFYSNIKTQIFTEII